MKRWRNAAIVAGIVIAGAVFGKNLIAKAAMMGGVKMVTGLDAQLSALEVGVLKPVIVLRDFKVLNPPGYQERVMLDMPELYVDYDLGGFFAGKAHLRHLRLRLDEFTVVKRADGQVNIQQIKALQQQPGAKQPAAQPAAGKAPPLQIDVLELKVGKVIYKDFTRTPPSTQEFAVNIDERYEHIANPYTLAGLIVTRALMKTTVAKLTNLDLAGLQAGVNDALKSSTELANQMAAKGLTAAQDMGQSALTATKGMVTKPGEVAGEVADTGKEALGAVQDTGKALKKLFGNEPR